MHFKLGYNQGSLNALKSIPGGVRVSFCTCNKWKIVPGNVGEDLVHRLDMIDDDVTTKDLIWHVASPCVAFLPTEAPVTPFVIMYECLRCFCLPEKPNEPFPKLVHQHEIAYVDGIFFWIISCCI